MPDAVREQFAICYTNGRLIHQNITDNGSFTDDPTSIKVRSNRQEVLSVVWTKRISGFFRDNGLIRFRGQFPKFLRVRLLHQAFVVALDDVRAVAGPRCGFALVLETSQMI